MHCGSQCIFHFHSLWMNTMNRWIRLSLLLIPLLAAGLASAQVRELPANAQRGQMLVTQPPDITLDGRPERLAPGARIRGDGNRLVLSATLVGSPQPVMYTRDLYGLIYQVWILTPEEQAHYRPRNRLTDLLDSLFGNRGGANP